jgi:DNA-directed RNA polymerase subunit RPC12/RpoP
MTLTTFLSLVPSFFLGALCLLYFFQLRRKSRLEKMDYQKIRCSNCGAHIETEVCARRVKCVHCGATNRLAGQN